MTRDLVVRARKGDHDAFAELAGAAISRLDATAWLMLRDTDRATDAVQKPSSAPGVICPRCATPTGSMPGCTAWWCAPASTRSDASSDVEFDVDIADLSDPPSSADAVSGIADRDQLERGFSRLEPEERAVIVLHHYLDLPLPEVAATLGIPLGTTKSRLYRGLKQMRAALDADARPGPDIREGRPA